MRLELALTQEERKSQTRTRIATGVYPKGSIDLPEVYSDFVRSLGKNVGSALSFLGVSRLESADGKKKIRSLVIESYERHANIALNKICSEVKKKYGLTSIIIVHSIGSFSPGEPVVLVAVAAPRRNKAFDALREAVERYKKEPALFKKEVYSNGSFSWIS